MVSLIAGMIGCGAEELIPDANLEEAIREEIGKPTGDIYPSDLAGVIHIDASSRNISDLTGLEHCTSLRGLTLKDNQISDISPLANLASLRWLSLRDNQITDISSLTNLTSLTNLILNDNQISEISSLANLTSLTDLDLDGNQISDMSPTTNLTSLSYLELADNHISDILPLVENEGLGVEDKVYLANNPLSDDSINIYIPQLEARGVTVDY